MSVHKEALENAIKVFKGRKDTGAVGVVEGCLERARRRVKDYQGKMREELRVNGLQQNRL